MDGRLSASVFGLLLCVTASLAADRLPGVTVESARERAQLRNDVDHYVSSALVWPRATEQTVRRWAAVPICPMVVGLPKDKAEFLLSRFSEITRKTRARLDTPTCRKPNLSIVVTPDPDDFVRRLNDYASKHCLDAAGRAQLADFARPRPVRTLYTVATIGIDGIFAQPDGCEASSGTVLAHGLAVQELPSQYASRLYKTLVTQDIESVIEIVDSRATAHLTMNQLAGYVSMLALANVNLDKDYQSAPTILNAFSDIQGAKKPATITDWDQALLNALYKVQRYDSTAQSEVEGMVLTAVSMPSR